MSISTISTDCESDRPRFEVIVIKGEMTLSQLDAWMEKNVRIARASIIAAGDVLIDEQPATACEKQKPEKKIFRHASVGDVRYRNGSNFIVINDLRDVMYNADTLVVTLNLGPGRVYRASIPKEDLGGNDSITITLSWWRLEGYEPNPGTKWGKYFTKSK